MELILRSREVILNASLMAFASPTINGLQIVYISFRARAFTAISGPMPDGSPILMPMIGFFVVMLMSPDQFPQYEKALARQIRSQ
jgi:hypothetical protein